jgi:hypothetical protein
MKRWPVQLAVLLAACGRGESPMPPLDNLLFSVQQDTVTGPDSTWSGWKRIRVEEDGRGHILVAFRLAEGAPVEAVASFLAALDTAVATPSAAVAIGGPEVGDTGEVIFQMTPGRYVLGCLRRSPDGHRHASTGEAKVLIVRPGPGEEADNPPGATQEVQMVDFAYAGPERWPAGMHTLRVENTGTQDHQLQLARLSPGKSVSDWIESEGAMARRVAGVARMGPGTVVYLPVDLPAGSYVVYCLVTDPVSGREHIEMGMYRAIEVE